MSSSKKRVVDQTPNVDTDSSSDDSSDDEDDYKGNEQIQVEFEGRIPVDSDFDGIKQLLHQLFLKSRINLSDLTELIIKQNYVGSVVKQCDDDPDSDEDDDMDVDDDVYGITTVVNLTDKRSMECIKQIRSLLMEKCKNGDDQCVSKVNQLLNDENNSLGLLINERFINIPPQISLPLLMNLRKEVEKAKNKKMAFDFQYYVMICKFYKMDLTKKSKKSKKKNTEPEPETVWSNAEEEIFEQVADYKFEFCVQEHSETALGGKWHESDAEMVPWRKVLIFPASKLDEAINRVSSMLQ